jgi:1,4-dihydroxy-2-naphthoate polyprenyltransferase
MAAIGTVASVVKLGRPLFLGGGFAMYALGAAIAGVDSHSIDPQRYALGQAAVTAFQLMTHYANEYFDYDADRANATPTRWSGGSRVLIDGTLPREIALIAALACATIGLAVTAAIALVGPPLAAAVLIAIAALAWGYSAPPLRLCGRGLGELDTAVVVTALVPFLGLYLQAPDLRRLDMLAASIVPLALLQFAMLLAIEFPDAAGDAATGKRTLVVRLGPRTAARLYAGLTALAIAWPPLAMVLMGLPGRVALSASLVAPIGAWRILRLGDHRDPAAYERLTSGAVVVLVGMACAELVGWLAD